MSIRLIPAILTVHGHEKAEMSRARSPHPTSTVDVNDGRFSSIHLGLALFQSGQATFCASIGASISLSKVDLTSKVNVK